MFPFYLEEQAFNYIMMQLNKDTLRYVCLSNEIIPNDKNMPRLNIQIILYKKKSFYTPFMDQFLGMLLILILI